MAAVTLGVYFRLWDYGGVWRASVSSQFNYLTDMLFRRPFLTWGDFTVGGYLAGLWIAYFLSLVQPSCVWLGIGGWFTELGLSGAVPWPWIG